MYTRKQALSLALQIRTCPPGEIKGSPAHSIEYALHLKQCPFCSTGTGSDIEAWWSLANAVPGDLRGDVQISIGQIRQIRPTESRWQDSLYYNSPFIVVLEPVREMDETVTVVQTWHDIYMGAPGDILVPVNLMEGPDELIVESWNIYRVKQETLGPVIGRVKSPVTEAVIRMAKEPDYIPPWAKQFVSLKKNDPRVYFRQVEKKVSGMFSISFEYMVKDLKEQIIRLIPGASWTWLPSTIEECMGSIRLPDEYMPLSASTAGAGEIVGVFYRFENQRLVSVSSLSFSILTEEVFEGEYVIAGKVPDILKQRKGLQIECYLENITEERLFTGEWIRDDAEEHYLIRFRKDKDPSDCVRIVVCDGTPA